MILVAILLLQLCDGKNVFQPNSNPFPHIKRLVPIDKSMMTSMVINPFAATVSLLSNQLPLCNSTSTSFIFHPIPDSNRSEKMPRTNHNLLSSNPNSKHNTNNSKRNDFLRNMSTFLLASIILFDPASVFALNSDPSLISSPSLLSSNEMGTNTDVYYPFSWVGKWEVEQTYIAIIEKEPTLLYINLLSQGQQPLQQEQEEPVENLLGKQITIKFVNNYVNVGDQVVLDRSSSERNKFQALLNNDKFIYDGNILPDICLLDDVDMKAVFLKKTNSATSITSSIVSKNDLKGVMSSSSASKNNLKSVLSKWDSSKPNILSLSISDGQTIETKVTKRVVETSLPIGSNGYSESSQILETSALTNAPKVFRTKVVERFISDTSNSNIIRGVERLYVYKGSSLDNKEQQIAIIKSNFVMKKLL